MIVAGLGFSNAATVDSLKAAYDQASSDHAVDALATVADKDGHAALDALAAIVDLPLHLVAPADLAEQRTLTCSPRSRASYGTGSVAEASALACLLYTSPSPRDKRQSRMPSSA